jgi:dihydrofolate synthase / folylpolyglutamate synthase
MEVMDRDPLTILDGAHNPAGALALGVALADTFSSNGSWIVILGVLTGRDPGPILDALMAAGNVDLVIAVAPPNPRALDPQWIVDAATERGLRATTTPDVERALGLAHNEAADDALVIVTGSLYLVAAARTFLTR